MRNNPVFYIFFLWLSILGYSLFSSEPVKVDKIKVLILSGSNNHNWQETTNQLEKIYWESELFECKFTLKPDTLGFEDFNEFDVVLSNWNSWPENELRWPEETERALCAFIKKGGGFVTFHASTSAFYKWPEFKKFTTASWILGQTEHGASSATQVNIVNYKHLITNGIAGFYLFDELWINTDRNPDFEVLATATNEKLKAENIEEQPAVMVSKYGKGRIFHTILGHDVRAMQNTGFKQLLLRGTEWVATGNVTQTLVQELNR